MENEFPEVAIEQCIDIVYNKCLVILENVVFSISKQPLQLLGLPSPSNARNEVSVNREYLREIFYDVVKLFESVAQYIKRSLIAFVPILDGVSFLTLQAEQAKRF